MTIKKMMTILSTIKNGVFTRFEFKSEPPMKAAYKKQGYKVVKTTSMTARTGVNYGNIKAVKEQVKSETPTNRKNSFVSIIANRVSYNTNTGKTYINIYPIKHGGNAKSTYALYQNGEFIAEGNADFAEEYVIPSYFNKNETSILRISSDNLIAIGGR